jgi:hypothetical protein
LDLHLLPNLAFVAIVCASFDLWISRDGMDIFALVIKNLNNHGSLCMLLWLI